MAAQINTTVLPAGPTKRIWVNKHHLPQFGGESEFAPVFVVECEGVRHEGYAILCPGVTWCVYHPSDSDGPHAYMRTTDEVTIFSAAEEAA